MATRTWAMALDALVQPKQGSTRERWVRAGRDQALRDLLPKFIMESRAEDLLAAIRRGKVSTNIQLRKFHNYCVAMTWLAWPLVPKPQ
ncbi:MAG: hypothetical protein KF791_06920 [Verrucomicrobiae bacterium]|nr:hypothetical protein [Verrucomicrobiae bacterium]